MSVLLTSGMTAPKSKHTPGPWKFEDEYVRANALAECDEGNIVADVYQNKGYEGEYKANAALIAAAPDLLAALKELADYMGPFCEDDDRQIERAIEARARAAIAKAEGVS